MGPLGGVGQEGVLESQRELRPPAPLARAPAAAALLGSTMPAGRLHPCMQEYVVHAVQGCG